MPCTHPWNKHICSVAGYPSSLLVYGAKKRMEALLLEQYRIDPPPPKDSEEYRLMCDKLRHKVWDECGFASHA